VLAGIVVGAVLAFFMRAWVESVIGASGVNPLALVAAAVLLSLVAALATYIPGRRATRVEPMQALRTD
jgi:ABC-type antimicrobial peptide transport system permease subunit